MVGRFSAFALVVLAACSSEVSGPAAVMPPLPGDVPYRDLAFPYGLYDAEGHLYAVFGGHDSAGAFTLHLRDAARFALLRDAGGPSFAIDLLDGDAAVARLAITEDAPLVAPGECRSAGDAYLHAATALIAATGALAKSDTHAARRRAVLAARVFRASWAVRQGCPAPD